MSETQLQQKHQRLEQLRSEVAALERELAEHRRAEWQPKGFYGTWYGTIGFMLGGVAALVSLMFNIIGSTIAGKHPLALIKVYLTFPLGEVALGIGEGESALAIDDGMILALGCCLYIGTGMVLGIFFHWILSLLALDGTLAKRLTLGTVLAVLVWFVNFYLILSWLQPMLFGGRWITDNQEFPWWVALATHLVFGWTMALLAPIGRFSRYERPTAGAASPAAAPA